MARKIVLNNGRVLPGDVGALKDAIWVYTRGLTMNEAFSLFSDSEATRVIRWEMDDESEPLIYDGYTALTVLNVVDGDVTVSLARSN